MRKKTFLDYFSELVIIILRPIIYLLMSREIRVVHTGMKINKKRDPFIMISNHFNTWDSFVVAKHIKYPIRFVATEMGFLDIGKKIGMGLLAQTIRKRVGKSDFIAVKKIFENLQKGYAIGLFPEGDNTFYGETLDIYQTTGRLIKKAGVDVILVKQQGGYVSQPRWADKFAKKGIVYTNTTMFLTKEEIKEMTDEQIMKKVEVALYNNDYDFQKEIMVPFNREDRALGIERLIYMCNKCHSHLSVYGDKHNIMCTECGTIGTINEFELIENNQFDNLVEYNHYQYAHIDKMINSEFSFPITLNIINSIKWKNKKIGKFTLSYKNKVITLQNNKTSYTFDIEEMRYPVNTMRHSFSFDYEDQIYNFTDIRHQFVLYEMCRKLNGSYKD